MSQHIKDRAVYVIQEQVNRMVAARGNKPTDVAQGEQIVAAANAKPVEWFVARGGDTEVNRAQATIRELIREIKA